MRKIILLLVVLGMCMSLKGEPISAVWVLPWNLTRPGAIDSVLVDLQANGQNRILAEIRYRADAIYLPNKLDTTYMNFETRSYIMKGSGFDALEYLLQEAKKYEIEVHAWLTILVVTPHDLEKLPIDHFYYKNADWITTDLEGKMMPLTCAEGYFVDPGIPEVGEYVLDFLSDIVLNYPELAGIHLDYMRYPRDDFGYHPYAMQHFELLGRENNHRNRMLWKEEVLLNLVKNINTRIKSLNPNLEFSVAVVADRVKARSHYSQNWVEWLEQGIVDKVYMMAYTKDDKVLQAQLTDIELQPYQDKIVVGLRAWSDGKKYPAKEITSKIDLCRTSGYPDIALFSYGGIMDNSYWQSLKRSYTISKELPPTDKN